ncbi:MAG: TIGR03086 family metal-binding protein [Actinomycetota bacterium]|nr:TIGR03086 family metal-binding protein [Actinomycetota bacterium]
MSTADLYRRAVDEFGRRIDTVQDDQWTNSTPCTEWDVRALVNHVVSEDKWVVPLLEGQTIEQVGTRLDGDLLGDDPKRAWKQTHADASNAVGAEGVTERTVSLSRGLTPAEDYLREVSADNVIHAWDLAKGTGGDTNLDPELVTFAYEFFEPQVEIWRSFGALGPEVPVPMDADRQTKLLGMMGRKV